MTFPQVRWLFLLVLLGQLTAPRLADACSCMQVSLDEAVTGAASVFEGKVTNVERATMSVEVHLDVVQTWKGANVEQIVLHTAPNSAACGYRFEPDQSYLVFTRGESGSEAVTSCSRTKPIDRADEDLAELGAGVIPVDVEETQTTSAAPTAATSNGAVQTAPREVAYQAGCASCSVGARRPFPVVLFWLGLVSALFGFVFIKRFGKSP